jgi:hypothetical protein
MTRRKIEQQNKQRATLAEALRTREDACIKNRYSSSQNHQNTSYKTLKTEGMLQRKIEQQKE